MVLPLSQVCDLCRSLSVHQATIQRYELPIHTHTLMWPATSVHGAQWWRYNGVALYCGSMSSVGCFSVWFDCTAFAGGLHPSSMQGYIRMVTDSWQVVLMGTLQCWPLMTGCTYGGITVLPPYDRLYLWRHYSVSPLWQVVFKAALQCCPRMTDCSYGGITVLPLYDKLYLWWHYSVSPLWQVVLMAVF